MHSHVINHNGSFDNPPDTRMRKKATQSSKLQPL